MVLPLLLVVPYLCWTNAEVVAAGCWACGCGRWLWRRLRRHGSLDSETWPLAAILDAESVRHYCNVVMGAYSKEVADITERTQYVKPEMVVKLVNQTEGTCPSRYIFLDKERREVVVCIRGLHLADRANYKTLADTSKGSQPFDGGFVHRGLLTAAEWLLDNEAAQLKELLQANPGFFLTVVGHSLGAGVASLFALLLVNRSALVGGLPRQQVRCYCVAPARSMSLNLAIRYADVINSVVLQDDFLPRTSTPIVKIFLLSSLVFTSAVFCWRCVVDTFVSEESMLEDPRRLYPPGRLFHVTYKEPCCWYKLAHPGLLSSFFLLSLTLKLPAPEIISCCSLPRPTRMQTAIPVEGRFERFVVSRTVTKDHHINSYNKFAEQTIQEITAAAKGAPAVQVMSRLDSLDVISSLGREDPNKEYATVYMTNAPDRYVSL